MSLFGEPDPVLARINAASKLYRKIEERYNVTKRDSFKDLVSPKRWEEYPLDQWYKYKEGYSSLLVWRLLDEFKANKDDIVLDPFLGSGTTLVGASRFGITRGHGVEVNPFSAMLSRVKLKRYTPDEVASISSRVKALFTGFKAWKIDRNPVPAPDLSIVDKLFGSRASTIVDIISFIKESEDDHVKEFMLAGLGCILEQLSFAKKDGNGLRYPPDKKPAPIASTLLDQYKMMTRDVRKNGVHGTFFVHEGDCRASAFQNIIGEKVKHVIFSPPYANCFDYVEVYKVELWMLEFIKEYDELKKLRDKTLSSHLNKTYEKEKKHDDEMLDQVLDKIEWNGTWGGEKTRSMISNYFVDMASVIENIHDVLAPGGTVTCIVGNSAYDYVPIATDLLIARIMERAGLQITEIRVARRLLSSVQQKKKMGRNRFMRESLVMAINPK